ncbi:prolyl 4-hydroxylase subunit alpha, putative [Hepatocystis sp. ex Piliocolobus tephrosceles]|nr:prolyl 4-hydroxylase subunit alpha, putative [Hepatocystis sp. ex Piliocolobus tephrosceles]
MGESENVIYEKNECYYNSENDTIDNLKGKNKSETNFEIANTTVLNEESCFRKNQEMFGIKLYDNDIKYTDSMEQIVYKIINKKNLQYYKTYSSFLVYLNKETTQNDSDEYSNELNDCSDNIQTCTNTMQTYTDVSTNSNDVHATKLPNEYSNNNKKVFFKIQIDYAHMSIFYNVIQKQVIEKLLLLCINKYKQSKTAIGSMYDKQENYKIKESTNRTSSSVFVYTIRKTSKIDSTQLDDENSIVYTKDKSIIEFENTICNLVKIPLCYLEPLAIVKYEKNNYFNLHHDGSFRRATFLIYLNDVDKDGETEFPHYKLSIKPIQGSGIFWYNIIPLEEKYAITYCQNRINEINKYEEKKNNKNKQQISNQLINSDINNENNNHCFQTEDSTLNLPTKNKNTINTTSDLYNFINNKLNLEKYSINVVKDQFNHKYISDSTMVHKANKVTDEYKYVINCFFNIDIVRNV